MSTEKTVALNCRFYRHLLSFFPAGYRNEYGPLMLQLFRDQCRDALQERPTSLGRVWSRTLADLAFSAAREHLTNQSNLMKSLSPSKASLVLFLTAVGLFLLASPSTMTSAPGPFTPVLLILSSLALLVRGAVEWFRPPGEWGKALLWMFVVLVVYGLICPFAAKLHAIHGSQYPTFIPLTISALLLNAIVPVVKAVMALLRRQAI